MFKAAMQSYPTSSTQGIPDKDSVFFHWDGQCNWVTCTLGREQMQVEAFTVKAFPLTNTTYVRWQSAIWLKRS